MNPKKLKIIIAGMAICIALVSFKFYEVNNDLKKYEKALNKRFGMHFLSCSIARLVLQSPFMTKRLLKIASVDKNTP